MKSNYTVQQLFDRSRNTIAVPSREVARTVMNRVTNRADNRIVWWKGIAPFKNVSRKTGLLFLQTACIVGIILVVIIPKSEFAPGYNYASPASVQNTESLVQDTLDQLSTRIIYDLDQETVFIDQIITSELVPDDSEQQIINSFIS
jgi:hypothetical protein